MKRHLRCNSIAAAPLLILTALFCVHAPAADEPPSSLKTGNFDRDPGWEGHHNRVVPKTIPMVKQDFGFSATHLAGKAAGEMGGSIQRSTTPATYAAKILATTLDDKLTASGSVAMTAAAFVASTRVAIAVCPRLWIWRKIVLSCSAVFPSP